MVQITRFGKLVEDAQIDSGRRAVVVWGVVWYGGGGSFEGRQEESLEEGGSTLCHYSSRLLGPQYMTKALSDDWMFDHELSMAISFPKRITGPGGLQRRSMKCRSSNTALTITSDVRCKDAIALLK
jgi:hypothetical protein